MKKSLTSLLLAALLAGCAANDPQIGGPGKGNSDAEITGYLSINLVTTGGTHTRDEATDGLQDPQYQYGTPEENYVQEVRFFFFYSEGGQRGLACPIRKNPLYTPPAEDSTTENPDVDANGQLEYFSYYDWTPTYADNQDYQGEAGNTIDETGASGSLQGGTIEKVLTAMVVLTGKEGIAPDQVVAIINPTPAIKGLVNPSLATLRAQVGNYLDNLTSNNFLMSNSAYVAPTTETDLDAVVIAQDITDDNLAFTQPEAQENPLIIYVERVVARLDQVFEPQYKDEEGNVLNPIIMNEGQEDEYTLYPTGFSFTSQDVDYSDDGSGETEYDNVPLYVRFRGWAVTSTPTKSNLIKNITAAWGGANSLFGTFNEPWFITEYHRSFWGMNPADITVNPAKPDESYIWYNYNELIGSATPSQGECFKMSTTKTYMQENANPYSTDGTASNPVQPTKVIYAAQLCDKEGTPVTVAEWNGVYFTLPGLKNLAASMLEMYYNSGTAENPQYTPIQPEQITFITRRAYEKAGTAIFSEPGSYYVYPTLTSTQDANVENPTIDNAASLTWYHHANDGTDTYTPITAANINYYMYTTFGVSKIWDNGQTYYFYNITHLGGPEDPGYYGVVRNHIYLANINKLQGLGTPVWDPTEDIYPEKPSSEGNNLSAQVKVLMWRLVSQQVEFDW